MLDEDNTHAHITRGITHKEGASTGKLTGVKYEQLQAIMVETILHIWTHGGNGYVDPRSSIGTGKSNTKGYYEMDSHTY
jgi:hypothetical protein